MNNFPPEYQENPYQARPDEARSWGQPSAPQNQPMFVPKRFGFGWSPNLANPTMAWTCLLGIGALVALAILFPLLILFLSRLR